MTESVGPNRALQADTIGQAQYNFPAGFVRMTDEPRQVFYDPFDNFDTTGAWVAPTTGNSGVVAAITSGEMRMGTGTVASGWSKLVTQASFKLPIPAWMGFSFLNNFPDLAAPTANAYRFWGSGTIPTTPTTAAPMTNAVGFEITTAGKMCAVVYSAGVRTQVADLSASTGTGTQPTDAANHRYIVYVRTDRAFWYIDSLATPVATSNMQYPAVQTLPMSFVAVGGATPPASNAEIRSVGATVWDTGKNNTTISDGTYPWRKAQITTAGELVVRANQNAVVSTVNSSTANLAAAATFTGTGESTLNVSAIQVNLFASQNCTVQCQQSMDGTNWDIADSFTTIANVGESRTFVATASFFRTVVTNNGGATTTALRLQSVLLSIGDPAPRALGTAGGLKIEGIATAVPVPTKQSRSATSTQTSVASSITVVTILASNINRLGATVYNEGGSDMRLHLGASASATVYTLVLPAGGYYEVPFNYTGIITGLWTTASAANNARVVELT